MKNGAPLFVANNLQARMNLHLWLTLLMFLAVVVTFTLYYHAEREIHRAHQNHVQSLRLAAELRQSSDDLTRMVRTYVASGNPRYKQYFQEILEIRDGQRPRPHNYGPSYWDLRTMDDVPPSSGERISLTDLMQHADLAAGEFAKLAEAKHKSDQLTNTEYAAMSLIEAQTPPLPANQTQAMAMLYDAAYHQAKANIMRPIREFEQLVGARSQFVIHTAEQHAKTILTALIVLGLLFIILLKDTLRASARYVNERQRMEQELRRSEESQHSLITALPDVIMRFDVAGRHLFASENVQAITGIPAAAFIGKTHAELGFPQEMCTFWEHAIHQPFATGAPYETDFTLDTPAGQIVFNWRLTPDFDEHHQVRTILAVARDITARTQAEANIQAQAQLLDLIFAHTLDSIVLLDKNYNFVRVSETYARSCQRDSSTFRGYNHFELYPSDLKDEFDEIASQKTIYQRSARPFVFPDHPEWGTTYWDLGFVPILDAHDEIIFFLFTLKNVTDRKRAEDAIIERELQLRMLNDNLPGGMVYQIDSGCNGQERRFTYLGSRVQHMHGISVEEGLADASLIYNQVLAEERSLVQALEAEALANHTSFEVELRCQLPNGDQRWRLFRSAPRYLENGHLVWDGVELDITERKQAEEALRDKTAKLEQLALVFSHAREGITITDQEGTIVEVNTAFCRITGYERDEVIGQHSRILKSGIHNTDFYAAMWRALLEQGYWSGEIWNQRKNGDIYTELLTVSAARDAEGAIRHYVALFSDITTQKEYQRQIEHMAHFDSLTNLPNRVLLADRLAQAIIQAKRYQQPLAVAYLDLDGFKEINDNYGHDVGDYLLTVLAQRMVQGLRQSDTIARLGGDEFVIVLTELTDFQASVPCVQRLLTATAQPITYQDIQLQVSCSIGIAYHAPGDEREADQLLREADQAMYQAKQSGKNRYHVFDAEHERLVRGHHESLEHIRRALQNREFVLYYQPKVNMRSGQVLGMEALIRWQHPERGLLSPALFLPEIENDVLAIEVGEWVIETALRQLAIWQAAGLDLAVSVNIAPYHLQQLNFVERLRDLVANYPSTALELELLESSALHDINHVSTVIETCATLGITFALDDFGTGYSSLTYLKRLPVNTLKIDQSFVRDMLTDADDLAILDGILGMARAFRRQIIAEGVESAAHGDKLLELGCEIAQGYGIARPLPAAEVPFWVATWQPPESWLS